MEVLILVQSIEKDGYRDLVRTQKETWDSVQHSQVRTVFYYPDPDHEGFNGQDLYIMANRDYYLMFNHFIKAISMCLKYEWDFLFKTDNSSYVNKQELVDLLLSKPRQKYYGGQAYQGPPSPDCYWPFLWGEGYALSRDVAERLVEFFEYCPGIYYGAEDMMLGRALYNQFPWDESLPVYQYWVANKRVTKKHHVYRCRKDSIEHDFVETVKAMHHVHHVLNILHNR